MHSGFHFIYVLAAPASMGNIATIVCYYVWARYTHIRASNLRTNDRCNSKGSSNSRKIKSLQQMTKGSVVITPETSFIMDLHIYGTGGGRAVMALPIAGGAGLVYCCVGHYMGLLGGRKSLEWITDGPG
jgi:hypothetical protein